MISVNAPERPLSDHLIREIAQRQRISSRLPEIYGIGPKLMGDASDKYRLTIGVFDDTQRLRNALNDLEADGWGDAQLCLLGAPYVLHGISAAGNSREFASTRLASLLTNLEERRFSLDGPTVFASSGPILAAIGEPSRQHDGSSQPLEYDLPLHLSSLLARHIETNTLVLFVNSTCASLQDLSARILLRHATHDILAHDFTPSQGNSTKR